MKPCSKILLVFFLLKGCELQPAQETFKRFAENRVGLEQLHAVITNPLDLRAAAKDALLYFSGKRKIVESQELAKLGLSSSKAKKALEFLVRTIDEDEKKGSFRILNPKFINSHFKLLRWQTTRKEMSEGPNRVPGFILDENMYGDHSNKIRLTSYAVFTATGSDLKTPNHSHALFGLKNVYKNLTSSSIISEQKIKKIMEPIVWLSQKDSDDALMQGSIMIKMKDGKKRLFNVHKNFQIQESGSKQWCFQEIKNLNGSEVDPHLRIIKYPGIVAAGNLKALGLGKIIALSYKNPKTRKNEIRLCILSDSGDAFKDNLHQLDLFAGTFEDRNKFRDFLRNLPNMVDANILVPR